MEAEIGAMSQSEEHREPPAGAGQDPSLEPLKNPSWLLAASNTLLTP